VANFLFRQILRLIRLDVFLSYIFHRRRTVFSDALSVVLLRKDSKIVIGICLAHLQFVHRLIHEQAKSSGKNLEGSKNEQICGSSEDGRGTAKPSPHVLSQTSNLASPVGMDQRE